MNSRFALSTHTLRWLAVILPIAFWIGVLAIRTLFFDESRTLTGDLFTLVAIALGSLGFSMWVFGIMDQREAEIKRRSSQLDALRSAALTLTTELDLATVLQRVVDLARGLVDARYGALGVLDENGEYIEQFITSGITPEQRALLGAPPRGHGLLGALIKEGTPIRIPEIATDPRSVGFPPNHPPMHSLLGVPITSKGNIIGDLYMTDKKPRPGESGAAFAVFNTEDQQVLEMFATQAAIAIENAQLYRQKQQLVLLQERERIGMDLHDGIIQSIYAIGLMLEDGALRISEQPAGAREQINRGILELNDVIRDIRNYILDLRPQRFQGRDLKRGLDELARDLRANSFLTVGLEMDGVDASDLTPEQTVEILHIAQEALTNVRKHAGATRVDVTLSHNDDRLSLAIRDDGAGITQTRGDGAGGHGLNNMRERARSLGGELEIEPVDPRGTLVTLTIPHLQE